MQTRMTQAEVDLHNQRVRLGRRRREECEGDQELSREVFHGREVELHRQIQDYCESKGWIPLHGSTAHRAMRTVGEYDFTIQADRGRTFFIEVKTATGKLSKEQRELHAQAFGLGHEPHVVRSFEDFLNVVNSTHRPSIRSVPEKADRDSA